MRLDGIPLAIELAAARIRHFHPQALLTRLEQGLTVLQGRADDVPARQQTLHGAIAWSYDLLTATEQRVFRRFAVCINGATMEAAEHICAGEMGADVAAVPDILAALVDQSMLQRQELEKEELRFWQLQTLREYGLACLTEAGELASHPGCSCDILSLLVRADWHHCWRARNRPIGWIAWIGTTRT